MSEIEIQINEKIKKLPLEKWEQNSKNELCYFYKHEKLGEINLLETLGSFYILNMYVKADPSLVKVIVEFVEKKIRIKEMQIYNEILNKL